MNQPSSRLLNALQTNRFVNATDVELSLPALSASNRQFLRAETHEDVLRSGTL